MAVKDIERLPLQSNTNGLRRYLSHLQDQDVCAVLIRRMAGRTGLVEPVPDVLIRKLGGIRCALVDDERCCLRFGRSLVEQSAEKSPANHASSSGIPRAAPYQRIRALSSVGLDLGDSILRVVRPPFGEATILELATCWIRARLRPSAPLSLVAGADSSHFLSLMQFLGSVAEHEPDIMVRAYDLGLRPYEREELERKFSCYILPRFDYDSHPPHVNIKKGAGRYAWKPIIVWTALLQTAGPVCWMDAGNMLTGRLDSVRTALRQRGFYSVTSRGTVAEWTHPAMLSYFGMDAVWAAGKRNLSGSSVGFHPRSLGALRLARRWRNGALIKKCIAPPGSNRSNHRQDQALLTVLAYMHGFGDAILPSRDGFVGHQDIDQNWRQRVAELDRHQAEIGRHDNGAGATGVRGR